MSNQWSMGRINGAEHCACARPGMTRGRPSDCQTKTYRRQTSVARAALRLWLVCRRGSSRPPNPRGQETVSCLLLSFSQLWPRARARSSPSLPVNGHADYASAWSLVRPPSAQETVHYGDRRTRIAVAWNRLTERMEEAWPFWVCCSFYFYKRLRELEWNCGDRGRMGECVGDRGYCGELINWDRWVGGADLWLRRGYLSFLNTCLLLK